jgi:hypothetical protein
MYKVENQCGSGETKTVYTAFLISLSKSEQPSIFRSSVFAAILHKQARKNPRMTPAKSHARNHIGHLFLPRIENNFFVHPRANFPTSKVEYNQYPDEGNWKNRIRSVLSF